MEIFLWIFIVSYVRPLKARSRLWRMADTISLFVDLPNFLLMGFPSVFQILFGKDCKDILIEMETLNTPITNLIHSKYAITQVEIDNLYTPLAAFRNKVVQM